MLEAIALLAVTPPPLPPAPVICDPFLLFFESGSARLSPESQALAGNAARAFEQEGRPVRVAGNADRQGSRDANRRLSLARAEAVRAALVANGLPQALIGVEGRGEDFPLFATADGVPHEQNRYVAIDSCSGMR